MPLDAVALSSVVNELNELLTGSKIEKIHQPERDEILLCLKNNHAAYRLTISASSANARIHLVEESKENPSSPPMFCMLLRKHITGGRIKDIKLVGFDRVVDISVKCRTELGDTEIKHLICEIMGRNSNIIFLDEEKRIIDSVKHVDITVSSVRNILPGLKYILPPAAKKLNPMEAERNDYYKLLKNAPAGREASRVITDGVMGISPLLSAECVFEACGNGNALIGEMSENNIQKTALSLMNMFDKTLHNRFSPCIIIENSGKAIDFAPFIIKQYRSAECIRTDTMNEAVCRFYFLRDRIARMNDRSQVINKIINNNLRRARKKLDVLQCELSEAAEREKYRIFGELITANLYKIKKGDKSVSVINYYDSSQPEVEIPLDALKSPSQNAVWYFSKYKKAKNTEIYAAEQLKITSDEICYLESVLFSVQCAQSPSELAEIQNELAQCGYIRIDGKKKKKAQTVSKPMEFEYKGYTIYVGKNNVQNDYLTLKVGRSRDLWLHTKNVPGSHTLVKYSGEEFPKDVIESAAKIAAYFSKGKNSPYVEVDYCPVSHVKKPKGAKAGMVIYEGYNTALVAPDKNLAEQLRR